MTTPADFSRMFQNQQKAQASPGPVQDKASAPTRTTPALPKGLSGPAILDYRADLSEKMRENTELFTELASQPPNPVERARQELIDLSKIVEEKTQPPSGLTRLFKKAPDPQELMDDFRRHINGIVQKVNTAKRPDLFLCTRAQRAFSQLDYLIEQLGKAGSELEAYKAQMTDPLDIDYANKRIATLLTQQQVVASSAPQMKQLVASMAGWERDVLQFLNVELPTQQNLCVGLIHSLMKS
jgi:DNA primase